MLKIVIALGGNALGNSPDEQKVALDLPAKKIINLIKDGHKVLVGHGNGPQVGMIFNTFISARKDDTKLPIMPFPEVGGMSQGYIGYHILTTFASELKKHKLDLEPIYFLTQTIVDENDDAFSNPTKPIGPFYTTLDEAKKSNPNSAIIEDSGRGYRKVVASPLPLDFIGINSIKHNFNSGSLVIAGGGGGIPTILKDNKFIGVDGVIDKDFALQEIANKIDADTFIVLTAVDRVFINYGKDNQKALTNVTVDELNKYINENQFAAGSMLPKVKAAIRFVEKNKNGKAIIASLDKLEEAIKLESGTHITFN